MVTVDTLKELECFQAYTENQLEELASISEIQSYSKDAYVEKENDIARGIHVVLKGSVAIEINLPMEQRVDIYMVRRGDLFGWSAVVPPHSITASSHCKEECDILFLPKEPLLELLKKDIPLKASFMEMITHVIRHRLKDTRRQMSYLLGG